MVSGYHIGQIALNFMTLITIPYCLPQSVLFVIHCNVPWDPSTPLKLL